MLYPVQICTGSCSAQFDTLHTRIANKHRLERDPGGVADLLLATMPSVFQATYS